MENSFQNIEDYFTGQLTDAERRDFEERCAKEADFAKDVSLYISMRGAIKRNLRDTRDKTVTHDEMQRQASLPRRKAVSVYALISGIAATVLIVVAAYYYLDRPDPERLASTFIRENLETISVTMGAEQDSLALGINAYNDRDFDKALKIFGSLEKHPSVQFECVKYSGFVFLYTGSYDRAVQYFDRLSGFKDVYANPGLFYKALTLMKRSSGQDAEEAKEILNTVVREKLAGHKEAERWLEQLE